MLGVIHIAPQLASNTAQIYDFIVNIPADGYIMSQFDSDSTSSYKELFLPGQPFKSLYAIHALTEYVESARRTTSEASLAQSPEETATSNGQDEVLHRALRLIVQALSDPDVLAGTSTSLKMRVASALMQTFVKLTQGAFSLEVLRATFSLLTNDRDTSIQRV